eukprot:scaffold156022_cov67-Attheya_sp.AAC.1
MGKSIDKVRNGVLVACHGSVASGTPDGHGRYFFVGVSEVLQGLSPAVLAWLVGVWTLGGDTVLVLIRGCLTHHWIPWWGGPPVGDLDEGYVDIANDAEELAQFFEVFVGAQANYALNHPVVVLWKDPFVAGSSRRCEKVGGGGCMARHGGVRSVAAYGRSWGELARPLDLWAAVWG